MNSLTLRTSVALACALSLAGCGGGGGNLQLSGPVSGLSKTGLALQNNGGTPLAVPAGASAFAFPTLLSNDQDFNVTVQAQPAGAFCTITNGKGRTAAFNITNVVVECITNSYALGGKITGLGNAAGLVLVNGSARQEISPGATSFTMTRLKADGTYASGKVDDGAPYGVTILTQPAGRTCTVANGVGTMGSADVTSIQVNCA